MVIAWIASKLGRAPSTISRELGRNGGQEGYRATQADDAAWDRALRSKPCKLVENQALARIVSDKLRRLWSPEQIAGWLKHTYPCDESLHVSHETLYRSLFIQARGALNKELLQHLRRTRGMRRSRHHTQKTDIHGQIVDAVSIRERPASAEDRAVPGHWEGDLLFGSHNSQTATLVERQTRYVMLVKVTSKDTQTVVHALIKNARKPPQELCKSLTWDRGLPDAGTDVRSNRCVDRLNPPPVRVIATDPCLTSWSSRRTIASLRASASRDGAVDKRKEVACSAK